MDDDTGQMHGYPLWILWVDRILSFHEEEGFERLEFPSKESRMEYVLQKTSHGFRIQ